MTNHQSKEQHNYELIDVWTKSKEHYDSGDYIEVWDNPSIGKTKYRFNKFDRSIGWFSSKMTKDQKSTFGMFMANEVNITDWSEVNDAFEDAMRKQIGDKNKVWDKIYTNPLDFN